MKGAEAMSDQELLQRVEGLKEQITQLAEQAQGNGDCSCRGENKCSYHAYVSNRLDETASELRHLATYIKREGNQ
jgi:predicted RNA-binding protein with PIN domain